LITRYRANSYSKAVDDILPSAIQIADKWHLLKNIGDTLNSILQSQYTNGVTIENSQKHKEEAINNVKLSQQELLRQARMIKNMELIEETKRLYASGVKQKDISVILGISKKTIYGYLRRSKPTYSSAKVRGSILDEHINKINKLFLAGTSSKDILLKIRECGYVGCESLLRTYLSKLKKSKELLNSDNKTNQASRLIKRERLYTIFWKSYDDLTEKNKLILNEVFQSSLQLSKICQSIQSFRAIISNKDSTALINWINDNIKSEITLMYTLLHKSYITLR